MAKVRKMVRKIEVISEYSQGYFKTKVNEFLASHKVIKTEYNFPTPILWRHGPSQTVIGDKSSFQAIIEYEE